MNIKNHIIFSFLFSYLLFSSLSGEEITKDQSSPLTINILSYRNGVGLDKDIDIMYRELTKLGHHVSFFDHRENSPKPKADINIFLEVVNENLFEYADKNYFIPNPDWYKSSIETLERFDKILCKTQESLRIFKALHPDCVFMSFSCEDRYDPLITKDFRLALHLAGGSVQKNTREVGLTWQQNPHLPLLTVIKHRDSWDFPHIDNICLINNYLSLEEIIYYQNLNGLHICPSGMEGFGHYIMEGLSCGAVVVTLDAPPMNEFVQDKRFLVEYSSTRPHFLATFHYVQPQALAKVVENILSLPEEELREIGKKNREFFLNNDRIFKEKLAEIFPPSIPN
jgi:hypothetical protein